MAKPRLTHTKAGTLMINWLIKEGYMGVCTHDGIMAEIGHQLFPEVSHPLNRAARVGQHLRRDSRFKNRRIRGYNTRGHECVLAYYEMDAQQLGLTNCKAE